MLKRYKTSIILTHYSREKSKEDAKKSALRFFLSLRRDFMIEELNRRIKIEEIQE